MKERIKGAFTKRKILHFLKMALFVVALSLILLSLLGTVAHATGLVDDTINAENLYSKYPLSNYQLDFYVDNSWSWLPWNWLDGIGKSVQYGLYCITNFVWTISLYLSNATGYVVQEAYKLDFINDMADSIGQEHTDPCRRNRERLFFYGLLCRFPASHYLSGGTLCCLYGTYQTGNQQGTSRCYQLCGGVRAVRFVYCLRSRLHQEDK